MKANFQHESYRNVVSVYLPAGRAILYVPFVEEWLERFAEDPAVTGGAVFVASL